MSKTKRIYERQSKEDGYRILVDRLWAKGLTKEKAGGDLWLKEIAPSNKLHYCQSILSAVKTNQKRMDQSLGISLTFA